jgi:hypothetical protein
MIDVVVEVTTFIGPFGMLTFSLNMINAHVAILFT